MLAVSKAETIGGTGSGTKWRSLGGYGVGDFGLNIYWHSLSLILVFWYTEVVGLDPALAGWIWALGLLWDAVSDPLVASISAANTSRWGSYRPFIFFGSFGLGLSFCLLFWMPPFEGAVLFITLLFAAFLFRTCYTIVAVPYSALSSRLTFDSDERAELSGVRMFFAFIGQLCIFSFFFPLSRAFSETGGTQQDGFFYAACVGAVVATMALILCASLTKERAPLGRDSLPEKASFKTFADAFARNGALRLLLIILFVNSAAGASLLIPLAFYLAANAEVFAQKEVVLTGYALASLTGTPIWTAIVRVLGKKIGWYLATLWMVAAGAWLALFGPWLVIGIPAQIVLFGFGGSAFAVIMWALIPDTVEYGQYTYGRRDEGPVFGASLFFQKASGALTGLLVGYVLSGIGYDADLEIQSSETAASLEKFIAILPPSFLILAALLLYLMPLSRDLHARIVDELSD
ncbi:MFS transporter [Erythrobacter sp. W53]|uniref:MFS transporter n=1 Tax=Erythrobacter sp. W53 TaxID=3425947 RepID=UPI003D769B92